ncbi:helix-turn-helix domain-containing protein [Paenibacillus phoenicis]|uniref:Helix-turn-helix domain-containing protein n=1 Tax=Paenibacillus phoenicis TaxID=554117 RepID=A0ABU5PIG7_9BACL|nr:MULTISPECIES: helix-turn-helix domain-containing protein [Paenibacillus]EES72194.1 HTH-type transcriptional activator HxlR [Paenibacillus sp. oral taxon 786 str. D14]MCT2195463.1 helix-turn-helix transcriptional regulator [Paenibacillus sp. p3-SID1389]MEA3569733.1 helix-turn-helix domain-containing protein [Paenibacillus phoenicis]
MEKIPELCRVGDALEILVGKWKPVILLVLLQEGTKRFSDLKRKLPDISQKMLTQKLRELEEEGIIERIVYPEVPPRVEYSITECGRSLEPLLDAMHSWGVSHVQRKEENHRQVIEEK